MVLLKVLPYICVNYELLFYTAGSHWFMYVIKISYYRRLPRLTSNWRKELSTSRKNKWTSVCLCVCVCVCVCVYILIRSFSTYIPLCHYRIMWDIPEVECNLILSKETWALSPTRSFYSCLNGDEKTQRNVWLMRLQDYCTCCCEFWRYLPSPHTWTYKA